MRRILAVVTVLGSLAALAGSITGGSIMPGVGPNPDSPLRRPVSLYVADGGVDTNPCSLDLPCRTLQRACDAVPLDICDAVTIVAAPSYTGTGCRKEGLRRCCYTGTDGGAVCGTFTVTGTQKIFTRLDGGTGAVTVAAVTNGNAATGQVEEWLVAGNPFAPGELAGQWVSVSSGTGSGLDQLWPILNNDGGVITLNARGEVKVHPTAGSTVSVYTLPDSLIDSTLSRPWANSGPPSEAQADKLSAFIFTTNAAAASGAYNDRWITVENFRTSISAAGTPLVASSGPGPVEVRHVGSTSAAALYRCVSGSVTPVLERNIITSTSGVLMLAYNTALGCDVNNAQMFNNYAPLSTNGFFIAVGSGSNIFSQSNYAPSALIRSANCTSCQSRLDTMAGIRQTADFVGGGIATGCWTVDGNTHTGTGQTYTYSLTGGCVHVDLIGPPSTIYAPNAGHIAALNKGAELEWAGTTVFLDAGTGVKDVVFTATPSAGVTVSDAAAQAPGRWTNWDQSWAGQRGGSFGRSNMVGPSTLLGMSPNAINSIKTHGGTCLRQPFEVTHVSLGIGSPAAGAGTNNQIRIAQVDGGSPCTATFPCASISTANSATVQTATGSCTYPAGTCLVISETSAGCTPDPALNSINVRGWNQ